MYLDSDNKRECCGCTACEKICPVNAIIMLDDSEGFKYPRVDKGTCIQCNKCRNVCEFVQIEKSTSDEKKECSIYAFKNRDNEVRRNSSSGGAFTALAEAIISQDGLIVGCAFSEKFTAQHIAVSKTEELWKIQKSKYVQSDLREIFVSVKEYLEAERRVLFVGSPCQVAGLKKFLYDSKICQAKLITCDFICHGVPSPLIFREYLRYISKGKKEIKKVDFRFKSVKKGWNPLVFMIEMRGKNYTKKSYNDIYYRLYFREYISRPCCHECRYSNYDRPSDITLGDFWGIEKSHPQFADDLGVSLLMINSEKGKELFDVVKKEHIVLKSYKGAYIQRNLESPTQKNPKRDFFWKEYEKKGFVVAAKMYGKVSFSANVRHIVYLVLKKIKVLDVVKRWRV